MTKFCFDCGYKLEYKFSPPNFCPQCGTSLKGAKREEKPTVKEPAPRAKSMETEDGYTDASFVPGISKLDIEVETFDATARQTLGSMLGKSAQATSQQRTVRRIEDL